MKVNFALICLAAAIARGQELPSFDVASIRPNTSGSGHDSGINISEGGRIAGVNLTLRTLIQQAYGVLPFQLAAGGPGWLDRDRYDVDAKTGRAENLSQRQLPPLLQNLLADCFRLRANRDGRPSELSTHNMRQASGKARVDATGASTGQLSFTLEKLFGRTVADRAELAGGYDFNLEWELDQRVENSGPSLFTALREQLGLRVESGKEPAEIIVIDSAEEPLEN